MKSPDLLQMLPATLLQTQPASPRGLASALYKAILITAIEAAILCGATRQAAVKKTGISLAADYRYRRAFKQKGLAGLIPRPTGRPKKARTPSHLVASAFRPRPDDQSAPGAIFHKAAASSHPQAEIVAAIGCNGAESPFPASAKPMPELP